MAVPGSLDLWFQGGYLLLVLNRVCFAELKQQIEQPFLRIDDFRTIVRRSHVAEPPNPYDIVQGPLLRERNERSQRSQMILSVRCRTLKSAKLWYGRILR
jgi:hypothetical protein